jgi:hypothetical protein
MPAVTPERLRTDPGFDHAPRILAATAENERVTPFSRATTFLPGLGHQEFINLALLTIMSAADLPGVNQLGIG